MGKIIRAVTLALVLTLVFASACAEVAKSVKDLEITPMLKAVGYSFTAEGHERVLIKYRSSQQREEMVVTGDNGVFKGVLPMDKTYAGSTVIVSLHTEKGRTLRKELQSQTAMPFWDAPARAEGGRLSGVTVCIDPGHQKDYLKATEDKGPGIPGRAVLTNGMARGVVTRRLEAYVVLEVGLALRDALLLEGADVVMTRDKPDAMLTNRGRAEIANDANADIFLRLHCNSRSGDTATGIVIYSPLHSDYAEQVADAQTYRLWAETLLAAMVESTEHKKPGNVKLNDSFVGNNWAKMPCFLVEMGYMSTPSEDLLLSTPEYQHKLVAGMVEGVYRISRLRGIID